MRSPIKNASNDLCDLIHRDTLWEALEGDSDAVSKITAARDVIEDTDGALRAYQSLGADPPLNLLYLATYGALQALYMQAVALRELCRALEVSFDLSPIRSHSEFKQRTGDALRPRHQVAGHPIDKPADRLDYYGISQPTLRHGSFTLVHWSKMLGHLRGERLDEIDLAGLIEDQLAWALGVLQQAIRAVSERAES